jgi:hypothetical protein
MMCFVVAGVPVIPTIVYAAVRATSEDLDRE